MNILTNPATRTRSILLGLAVAIAALLVIPSTSHAARFGASLTGADPVNAPVTCFTAPGNSCTRVPVYYGDPPHTGKLPYAPKNGTVRKIKLKAASPGTLRIQMAKVKGYGATGKAKITRNGPRIDYLGTGQTETFDVSFQAKKGEWLAFKTKYANTLQCDPYEENELEFQPVLHPGNPFASPDVTTGCTHLIQARIK